MSSNNDMVPKGSWPEPATPPDAPAAPANYRRPVMAGLTVIALAFGGFGTWAATAPLDSAVIAPGVLSVESNRKTVQHLEGGIISEILAEEGDRVEKGEVLIRLDGTRTAADLAATEARLAAARAKEARLIAEREGLDEVDFPADLLADPRVAEAIADEKRQFEERRKSLNGQIAILEQRIVQLNAEVEGYEAQRDSREKQVLSLRQEINSLRKLLKDGYVARNRILALERDLAELEGDHAANAASVSRAREDIASAQLQILQVRQEMREKVAQELRDVRDELDTLEEKVVAARDVARRLEVLAPVSGVVQNVRVFTEGGVIPQGGQLMDIVPQDEKLVVETRVPPRDVAAVMVGQTAEVRFPALERERTPIVEGVVAILSADRLTDQRTGEAYYHARVEIPAGEQEKLGDQRLQAGMPAEVVIKLGERTALNYLMKPLQDSFSRALTER